MHHIHPFFVHFIISFFFLVTILELFGKNLPGITPQMMTYLYVSLAFISLFTLGTGCLAGEFLFVYPEEKKILNLHETLGTIISSIIFLFSVWRAFLEKNQIIKYKRFILIIVLSISSALLYVGYLGGEVNFHQRENLQIQKNIESSPTKSDSTAPHKIEQFEAQ